MVNVLTDAFKSFETTDEDGEVVRVDEGDTIQFALETGEKVKGKLTKISGKGDKTKLQIVPDGGQKEEIWSVLVMAEGSLSVVTE
jgi:translation initiation factor IF-1